MKLAEPAQREPFKRSCSGYKGTARGTGDVLALRPGQGGLLENVQFEQRHEGTRRG